MSFTWAATMREAYSSIHRSGSAPPRTTQATSISQPISGAASRITRCGTGPSLQGTNSKSWLCQAKRKPALRQFSWTARGAPPKAAPAGLVGRDGPRRRYGTDQRADAERFGNRRAVAKSSSSMSSEKWPVGIVRPLRRAGTQRGRVVIETAEPFDLRCSRLRDHGEARLSQGWKLRAE
jgi:hypothetical protein